MPAGRLKGRMLSQPFQQERCQPTGQNSREYREEEKQRGDLPNGFVLYDQQPRRQKLPQGMPCGTGRRNPYGT